MAKHIKLHSPWLVAVWPGLGYVGTNAGYYLMAKMGMHAVAEFAPRDLFDPECADVSGGLIRVGRLPRSQLFVGNDSGHQKHDILLFMGEAQPALGKYALCQRLIECAQSLGVERVFTFASVATPMHPEQPARVFAAATDRATLAEFQHQEVELLDEGQIGGLNGLLLGVAAERGMHGACLMGEIPQLFAPLPSLQATLAVLEAFTQVAGIEMDLGELQEQAANANRQLGELFTQIQAVVENQMSFPEADSEEADEAAPAEVKPQLIPADKQRIETLFDQVGRNRTKAYELKSELDRLEVFAEYEDRFLDLFQTPSD